MLPVIVGIVLLVVLLVWQLHLVNLAARYRRRLERAEVQRGEVVNFVDRFASSIITSSNTEEWMQLVASYLAQVVEAEYVVIFMIDGSGQTRRLAVSGELPPIQRGDYELSHANRLLAHLHRTELDDGEGPIGEVILGGEPLLIERLNGDDAGAPAGLKSMVAVPMTVSGQHVGAICALNKKGAWPQFGSADLFLLETLSTQVALGGTLIEVYREFGEQQRLQQELRVAQVIQKSLLPRSAPRHPQFGIHGVNIPARVVSGDFYDFVEIDDDYVLVVIADAAGKGVPACLLMAMCRTFVRMNAVRFKDDLEGLLKELNRNLFSEHDEMPGFVTMACCLIDRRDCVVEYARAGHTELLVRSATGEVSVVYPDGPALGLLPHEVAADFDIYSFSWQPDSSLLLFTDGITEALNDEQEEFGLERLVNAWGVQDISPEAAADGILEKVKEFTGATPQEDDQTLVVLSHTGH